MIKIILSISDTYLKINIPSISIRFFEFKDKSGKVIYLTDERWSHINTEHPEIINYFNEFNEILNKPTKIIDHLYDNQIKYYYKYFKNRK